MFQLIPKVLTESLDAGDSLPLGVTFVDRQRIADSGHYVITETDRFDSPQDFTVAVSETGQATLTWKAVSSIPNGTAIGVSLAMVDQIVKVVSTSEVPLVVEALSAPVVPLGYQQISGLNVVKQLSVPEGANYAIITPMAQAVRWRDDGGTPTGSVGYPLPVGKELYYDGSLDEISFIEQAASAILEVAYYA